MEGVLNRHGQQIVASDFFTIEVWTPHRPEMICRPLLYAPFDAPCRDRRNRKQGQWFLDGRKLLAMSPMMSRILQRKAVPDSPRISHHAGRAGDRIVEAAAAIAEFECPRGKVRSDDEGGLLNYYHRAAASAFGRDSELQADVGSARIPQRRIAVRPASIAGAK